MLNYSELSELLRQSGSAAPAADCHGFLCGHLCVADMPERDVWEEYLDLQTDDDATLRECHEQVDRLLEETQRFLLSPELDFQLLLPDDGAALSDRVAALGEWCHGFLNGFAHGRRAGTVIENGEGSELIENFTRICQVESNQVGDESDEQALFELIEYVRLGAIYIHDMSQPADAGTDGKETLH